MLLLHFYVFLCPVLVDCFNLIEFGQKLWSFFKLIRPGDCRFVLNEDIPVTPLILSTKTPIEIIYPDNDNVIVLSHNKRLRLSCGDKFFNSSINGKKVHDVIITCVRDTTVSIGKEEFSISDLECVDFPKSVIKSNKLGTCLENKTLIDVGFEIDGQFLKIYSACFDRRSQNALYSWYDASKLHNGRQYNVPRPVFTDKEFYTFNVDAAYYLHNQRSWMGSIMRSFKWAARFILNDHMHYLCRGHLSPKADFVYGVEQSATFHFVNAAPQWHIFNVGNWGRLENAVRDMLVNREDRRDRYRVVTGTHGIATLPDVNNNEQELYLYEDENKNPLLKVPKLFWKLVYDMNQDQGVVIIGVNNPYLKKIPSDYIICKNICNKIRWLPEFNKDNSKGYIYCCEMDEFLKVTGFDKSFMN
ncbi:uncharacterized protein LOC135850008 isoform X1 [Planococcus citri]|uniref:uncharacterized protein LOC135850008 isoform X1 n=1 Tax=Planococcus citri TaxID=170843 RepID=UPI0031F8D34C